MNETNRREEHKETLALLASLWLNWLQFYFNKNKWLKDYFTTL